jgi:hypothetical protein
MALCIECSPPVQEVPGSIPDCLGCSMQRVGGPGPYKSCCFNHLFFYLTAASPSCGSAASTARTVRSCVTARTPSGQRASARGSSSATGQWSAGSGSAYASQSSPYDGAGYSGTYHNTNVRYRYDCEYRVTLLKGICLFLCLSWRSLYYFFEKSVTKPSKFMF